MKQVIMMAGKKQTNFEIFQLNMVFYFWLRNTHGARLQRITVMESGGI